MYRGKAETAGTRSRGRLKLEIEFTGLVKEGKPLTKIQPGKITCRFHLLTSELVPFYCSLTDNQLDQDWELHIVHFQHSNDILQ